MKKNIHFRRIPDYIEQELRRTNSQHVKVAAIVNASRADISRNVFRKFGITLNDGTVQMPDLIAPNRLEGLYARRNRNGLIWVLKNLPKVKKTYSWETPNFGDPDKGYHTTYMDRDVYQRRFEPPRDWDINLSVVSEITDRICFKATINTVLDKQDPDFRDDLFFAVNLLQEQFRDCHVFDANLSDEELARITSVGWEIFPPGTLDNVIHTVTDRMHTPTESRKHTIQQRTQALDRLHPSEYIVGQGMNSRYFGAKFGDNIVAFENADYGNALYILFDNWQEISQMSRIDILKRHERDYIRIIHKDGWEEKLREAITDLRTANR